MLNTSLIRPKSIVVIGGSDNIQSPGGNVLKILREGHFKGEIRVVNPKKDMVQGIKCYRSVTDLPSTDMAIIAIAAKYTLEAVRVLTKEKNTRGFIIISAGFSEKDEKGAALEREIVRLVDEVGGSLLGPNCIGLINPYYTGVFTTPIPKLDPSGVDFISGSGATAVFITEAAMPMGLTFSRIYSVGNSAQIGVEEVLEHLDETFDPKTSSKVKILYIESIDKPQKLLKHATSLINKGCRIAVIKSGSSDAGSRAASSHTGALANPDVAVDALFKKAGIIRAYGRNELITIASVLSYPPLTGKRIAVITHAGGPAVMLTDVLSANGLTVPALSGKIANELKEKLFPGSSVANPIDFLATGTAAQLETIIDYCDTKFEEIDAMVVIFGSPGLFEVYDVYEVLDRKMRTAKKPIYPVLPSLINVKEEIDYFIAKGNINFPFEVLFGHALAKVYHTPKPASSGAHLAKAGVKAVRKIINNAEDGYLSPVQVRDLLEAVGVPVVEEEIATSMNAAVSFLKKMGTPVAMKVIGPVHKTDTGGVILDVKTIKAVKTAYRRLMKIEGATGVLIQPMKSGLELFVGAKKEDKFGHIVMAGMGGIFIEVLKDVQTGLAPLSVEEATAMVRGLKSYPLIKGMRGQKGIDENKFVEIITKIAALVTFAPEIVELDLNPLMATADEIVTVDARIRIEL